MEVFWTKTIKEITPEKLETITKNKKGKIKIRKGKSGHAKAQKLAQIKEKYDD